MTSVEAVLDLHHRLVNLHHRLVTRMEGVIEDDGTVTPVSAAEAILSTQEECGECRQPWPCRTVAILTYGAEAPSCTCGEFDCQACIENAEAIGP